MVLSEESHDKIVIISFLLQIYAIKLFKDPVIVKAKLEIYFVELCNKSEQYIQLT